jgi:hypothetical protein
MFPMLDTFTGRRFDRAYAETRAKWEPLYEVTQIKGDGEAHPFLSPTDEFADYETWDAGNLDLSVPKENDMLQYEYARQGLQIGLQLERQLGVNPYKFGMVGFGRRAQPRALRAPDGEGRRPDLRELVDGRLGLRGRVGEGKHTRGAVRRDDAA